MEKVPPSTGGSPQSTDGSATQYQSTYQSLQDARTRDFADTSHRSGASMVSSGSNYGTDQDTEYTPGYVVGGNSDDGARAAWGAAGADVTNNGTGDASTYNLTRTASGDFGDGTLREAREGPPGDAGEGSGPPSPATIAKRALERSRKSNAERAAALSSNAAIPHNDTAFAPDDLRQVPSQCLHSG